MPEDKLYLSNIYEAALKIESYTESGRAAFMSTPIIQDAVIRNFEIIGEATKRLSDEVKQENSELAWRQMAGFRDVLIHDYMKVKLTRVWEVIEQDLPGLKHRIKSLLDSLEAG
ncbi:DUF86 domain-containing protein [Halomicronema sp. CCY15110]|uniref:HepT-like ribonuclease domain-containing protein n=1 Tax=Halomicronema sp. CCY15110 TaxID=2767773 RepID=UPI00194EA1DF